MPKTDIYTQIPARTHVPLFIFCDHASKTIPPAYTSLGLGAEDQSRHIAWDIGAAALTQTLCAQFGAGGLLAGFSRLLIDANRDPAEPSLIPVDSDGTIVPGNQSLSAAERAHRQQTYFHPYHAALSGEIDQVMARAFDPLIISMHSFTPHPKTGARRAVEIGMMWKANQGLSADIADAIRDVHPYRIGLNEPYSGMALNYSIDTHIIPRGLRHITFEIRQDLIGSADGVQKMAAHLAPAIARFTV